MVYCNVISINYNCVPLVVSGHLSQLSTEDPEFCMGHAGHVY
jgi:hypothetical protein